MRSIWRRAPRKDVFDWGTESRPRSNTFSMINSTKFATTVAARNSTMSACSCAWRVSRPTSSTSLRPSLVLKELSKPLRYGNTFSVRFTLETAPFGAVAVTTKGYSPGFVAAPPGDFGKLLHADIPTAISTKTPNDSANRGRRLNVHIAPHSDTLASNSARPPPRPPGTDGPNPGTAPLQNVFTTIATLVVFPVNVMVLGTMLHVMFAEMLVQPSVTVPVVPGNAVSVNPNIALLPGVVFTVEGLPGASPIVTGEFPLLNVAVTV